MADSVRFIMLGGFLGAGKTTAIARLARDLIAAGRRVGIVTNDQAADLVDTTSLRAQGFPVGEVAGACFCCHFDELMETIGRLSTDERPDVILSEPVGSCTDLVATVIEPIRRLYAGQFEIAPYCVILKPSHGRRVLLGETAAGFSPKAAYILLKQLEEADAVLINRVDELTDEQIEELTALVRKQAPEAVILPISAKDGTGFDELHELLNQSGEYGRRYLDIDYDTYAEGEAELGWLNSSLTLHAEQPVPLDPFLVDVVDRLRRSLAERQAETAHLKVIGLWEGFFAVVNLVSSDSPAELSLPSGCEIRTADVIVNARVACEPEMLKELVDAACEQAAAACGATVEFRQTQSFRPGRPVPTHRFG